MRSLRIFVHFWIQVEQCLSLRCAQQFRWRTIDPRLFGTTRVKRCLSVFSTVATSLLSGPDTASSLVMSGYKFKLVLLSGINCLDYSHSRTVPPTASMITPLVAFSFFFSFFNCSIPLGLPLCTVPCALKEPTLFHLVCQKILISVSSFLPGEKNHDSLTRAFAHCIHHPFPQCHTSPFSIFFRL